MLAVVDLVLPLFGLIFLGFAAGKLVDLPPEGLAWMNIFIIYVALPALFFRLLSQTPVSEFANIGFIALSALMTFSVFMLVFAIAMLGNRRNIGESAIQGFAAAYGNIGYLGPPLALAAFGPKAGVPVALIFCFENAMHFTLAPLLMSFHGERRGRGLAVALSVLRNIFTHPFILATIAGIAAAAAAFQPPAPLETLLDILSGAAAPAALFAMGVMAAIRPLKRVPAELGYIVPAKLLVHPLLVYGALTLFMPDLDAVWLYSAVLLAALPTAANVFVLAQQYAVWQERASSAVVITTILASFSVTGVIYAIRSGWL